MRHLAAAAAVLRAGGVNMRWALAVGVLTLVALTSPIAAGDKRSAALAVRVTVVRSCSVNTDSASGTGDAVNCGTRFGPPVMSTTSTVTMPLPSPPPARIESSALPAGEPEAVRPDGGTVAPPTPLGDATRPTQSPRDAGNAAGAPPGERGAATAGDADSSTNAPGASVRLLTINF